MGARSRNFSFRWLVIGFATTGLVVGVVLAVSYLWFFRREAPKTVARRFAWEEKTNVEQHHDFGLVLAGQRVRRRFQIRNDSEIPWTLAHVHNHCKCTASQPLVDQVLPGQTMEVDVDYIAPQLSQDDSRGVGVEFAEEAAPFVWLKVHANVREAISVQPAPLNLLTSSAGQVLEGTLRISNYTDHDVKLPTVTCSVPWLKARLEPAEQTQEKHPPRQKWRAHVRVDTAGLRPGEHQAQIVINFDDQTPPKVVPVVLGVQRYVEIVPQQVAFGTVSRNAPCERKILLRLAPHLERLRPGELALTHNAGEQLKLSCREVSATVWELVATLTVADEAPAKELNGSIRVSFGREDLAPVQIPFAATIRN